jgi:hypothetical protein
MPIPKPGEKQKDFVNRCVPFVLREPKHKGMKPDQATAMCHSLYKEKQKGALNEALLEVEVISDIGVSRFVSLYDSVGTYMEHMAAQSGTKAPMESQTLIMSKTEFKTKGEAKAWAKEKGFKQDDVRETTASWRLRQRSPEDFNQSSFRMITMRKGVQSVVGHIK